MYAALVPILFSDPPGWVRSQYGNFTPSMVFDFQGNNAWVKGTGPSLPSSFLSVSRASTEFGRWADGHWSSFAVNTPVITDLGLQVYQAATNTALYSRDMTNVVWTPLNMTAALTATGIDNTANSASTLTATADNATILQTLTIASSAETYSVFLKRVSGTGTINITENGGTTWTPVTLTTAWQRFSVEATLANPVVGVQIVTNGDVIAADFNQVEANTFATPPILVTGASATRAADVIKTIAAMSQVFNATAGTILASIRLGGLNPASPGINQVIASIDDGTTNNYVSFLARYSGGNNSRCFSKSGGSADGDVTIGTMTTANIRYRAGLSWGGGTLRGTIGVGAGATDASATSPVSVNDLYIGNMVAASNQQLNGIIERLAIFKTGSTIGQMSTYTRQP